MKLRVSLMIIALAGTANATAPSQKRKRLQWEHRRRNFWNTIGNTATDIGDMFVDLGDVDVPMDEVFKGVWSDAEDFFTEDMIGWFENDFANFWIEFAIYYKKIGEDIYDWGENAVYYTSDQFISEQFTIFWTATVDAMDVALEWTEDAAVTAWSETEDYFQGTVCAAEEIWWGDAVCTSCLKEACNAALNDDVIAQMDVRNEIAIMDMNNEFEVLYEGCASAMESCPPVSDCEALKGLPESTRIYVAPQLAQCNMCYQCLPYGSTQAGCKKALDQTMPDNCRGCTTEQQMMYNSFFSCSSLKKIHDSITTLGEQYKEGGIGNESLDEICDLCLQCSSYETELSKTCKDWALISDGYHPGDLESLTEPWDCEPPAIPDVLMPEGMEGMDV